LLTFFVTLRWLLKFIVTYLIELQGDPENLVISYSLVILCLVKPQ